MQYEYFYGAQAEQFSFYRIPKALFTERNISMIYKKMNMMRDKSICMENRENGLCSY